MHRPRPVEVKSLERQQNTNFIDDRVLPGALGQRGAVHFSNET